VLRAEPRKQKTRRPERTGIAGAVSPRKWRLKKRRVRTANECPRRETKLEKAVAAARIPCKRQPVDEKDGRIRRGHRVSMDGRRRRGILRTCWPSLDRDASEFGTEVKRKWRGEIRGTCRASTKQNRKRGKRARNRAGTLHPAVFALVLVFQLIYLPTCRLARMIAMRWRRVCCDADAQTLT
jgi:hypothetical protein